MTEKKINSLVDLTIIHVDGSVGSEPTKNKKIHWVIAQVIPILYDISLPTCLVFG